MDLSPYIAQLREDLATAASAGDDDTRRTAAVLSAALEPAARLALMNALSDLAAEVTVALDGPVVEVRLDGRDVQVVVTGASPAPEDPEPEPSEVPRPTAGDVTRITLRLLDELKSKAEQAAASQGMSLNTFVAHAVQGAVGGRRGRQSAQGPQAGHAKPPKDDGSRVRGWVQG
ncbi:toxin-antitoxin system HicB family antitoxin [Saccharothrix australiensis]|uniref:HicB-like protein involved in pilus formation n=1 Tax=Saccharothrix australiensis TaxID=2072 RepID=A0A495W5K6_9PSEU|nr:toxin-antitoxin system HicB family antitoxin [Saccharothrix australiensis]RKT56932.1 HicB-like protein involved in pilus formation [Saccharothrix australiensis]